MRCEVKPLGTLSDYKYVVVLSFYRGLIVLSRHKRRDTWETQGGHIEAGETPLAAARRELYEESGVRDAAIAPLFDYWAGDDCGGACGRVFRADIRAFEPLPDSEMAEVGLFATLPAALTYPVITPELFHHALTEE
ncbi:MAG: NUDIX domain-containing protein [Clostridia bacterium]|nr:NUDIX domain-containing protein [Clostridia bacterium]